MKDTETQDTKAGKEWVFRQHLSLHLWKVDMEKLELLHLLHDALHLYGAEHKDPHGLFQIYIYLSYMQGGNGNDNSYWMVSKDTLPRSQKDQISKLLF